MSALLTSNNSLEECHAAVDDVGNGATDVQVGSAATAFIVGNTQSSGGSGTSISNVRTVLVG